MYNQHAQRERQTYLTIIYYQKYENIIIKSIK